MSKPTRRQIATAISTLLADGVSVDKVVSAVAAYLSTERRTRELETIMRLVTEIRERNGVHEAVATSAFDLDKRVRAKLEHIIAAQYENTKQVILRTEKQPSLVGGVRLEVGGLQLDLSVRNRLQHLSQLTSKTTQGSK